ncbi:spermine synthase [Chloroflexota bacterium]
MNSPITLSYSQADLVLRARQEDELTARMSLDLGLTTSKVRVESEGIVFPDGQQLHWGAVEEISRNESVCFVVEGNTATKIQTFSDFLNRFYSLMPTSRAPTLLVSGIPMHRIKGIDPHQDTLRKIRAIAPVAGRVLDTCTGLGYTAIEAAKTAKEVVTIELDPTVLEVTRLNPWSQRLFEHPRIQQIVGDSFEEIWDFEDEAFSRIIHDPPTFSLAGDLYSGEFYSHLFRVLRGRGRLFHYVGDLESRSGRNVVKGVGRRLQEAGFSRIVRKPRAFGVVAYK